MRWLRCLCLAVWLALLLLGSLLPYVPSPDAVVRFPGAAYVAHAIAYAVLCVLASWALVLRSRRALAMAAVGAFLLGVALECIQPLTGRTFDLLDMAANAAGVGTGLAAMLLARAMRGRGGAGQG